MGPVYKISNNVVCATSKASDQPAHTRSLNRAFASHLSNLLTEHHMEFLSFKGGCTVSSELTHVKMSHCWKYYATAQFWLNSLALSGGIQERNAFGKVNLLGSAED